MKYSIVWALILLNIPSVFCQKDLVDVSTLVSEFDYEIRYATAQNFMEEPLYDCAKCLLRPEVAAALLKANQFFCEKGYKIKLFDCYRPLEVQKKNVGESSKCSLCSQPLQRCFHP